MYMYIAVKNIVYRFQMICLTGTKIIEDTEKLESVSNSRSSLLELKKFERSKIEHGLPLMIPDLIYKYVPINCLRRTKSNTLDT